MSELLHQFLPVAAGAEVCLVETPDVLDDFLPLHALPQRDILSDISSNLGYVFGLSIQPLDKTEIRENGVNREVEKRQLSQAAAHLFWVLTIFFSHAALLVFSSVSYLSFSYINNAMQSKIELFVPN